MVNNFIMLKNHQKKDIISFYTLRVKNLGPIWVIMIRNVKKSLSELIPLQLEKINSIKKLLILNNVTS